MWDLNATPAGSSPRSLTSIDETFFFAATEATGQVALWKSDGTEAGTILVKGGFPPDQIYARCVSGLEGVRGKLFFWRPGWDLWTSDGTEAGTILIKGGFSCNLYIGYHCPSPEVFVGNRLFFIVSGSYQTLWASDGTEAGTIALKQLGSLPDHLPSPVIVDGRLFFGVNDGNGGYELWVSDGTTTATRRVKPGFRNLDLNRAISMQGRLFFGADDSAGGSGLWVSDGTEASTLRIGPAPGGLTEMNGAVLFIPYGDSTGWIELWTSDGTVAGTMHVRDLDPRNSFRFSQIINVEGCLFLFTKAERDTNYRLWMSDGTAAGTLIVTEGWSDIDQLANVQGRLFFSATVRSGPYQLWTSDGTTAGTIMLTGTPIGYAAGLSSVNGTLSLHIGTVIATLNCGRPTAPRAALCASKAASSTAVAGS